MTTSPSPDETPVVVMSSLTVRYWPHSDFYNPDVPIEIHNTFPLGTVLETTYEDLARMTGPPPVEIQALREQIAERIRGNG